MAGTCFEENIPAPRWLRAAGVVVLVFAAALLLIALLANDRTQGGVASFALGIAVCALVGSLLISIRMQLRITDDTLTLALAPVVTRRIRITSIATATIDAVCPSQLGGIGYRMTGPDRAFLFSGGPAVAITMKGTPRRYLWRTDNAETVLAWISSGRQAK